MKMKSTFAILATAVTLFAYGQRNSVIDSLENVLRTAREDTSIVNAFNELSNYYRFTIIDIEKALQYADSARTLASKMNYQNGLATAQINFGLIYHREGNSVEALKFFNLALKIYEETGDKAGIADVYRKLAIVFASQGANAEAMAKNLAALKIYEEIGDYKGDAEVYRFLGHRSKEKGNFADALKYYELSLALMKKIGDKDGEAASNKIIGQLYQDQGNNEEAIKRYLICKEIHEESGNTAGLSHMLCCIGIVYHKQKNYPEALRNFHAALNISQEFDRIYNLNWAQRLLAKVYIDLKKYSEARKYLEAALTTINKNGYHENRMNTYRLMAILDSAEGNYASSLEYYKRFKFITDSVDNVKSKNQMALMLIQYETEKKDQEITLLSKEKELQKQQLEKQRLVRNGMIAGTFLFVLLGLLLFRSFRLRKKLEKQQAIIQERKRISADLHDEVGSGLSRIMLLSEMVKNVAKTPETRKEAEKIATVSLELSSNISEIIWALNSNNDYVENLVAYIRRYAAEYFENSPVRLRIVTPGNISHIPVSSEHRRNIFYAVKEVLHNIIKHSEATEAELTFSIGHDLLSVIIKDNGKGMPTGALNRFGNGLRNMKSRMENINGSFVVENDCGTKIKLSISV